MATKRGGKGKGPGAWQSSVAYQLAIAKIVEVRKSAGMTQRDIANKLGKPPSWVAKIESNERRLDIVEFVAVARALEIDETELLRRLARVLPKALDI